MNLNVGKAKYVVSVTSRFKKDYKKIKKQQKDISKLIFILEKIANGETLDSKYKNHKLINDKTFQNCSECHIEPDWLLIYRIENDELVLLLLATGSHSDLFNM